MFCFFQHDISDDVNAGEGVKLYRLLLDGSLGKEKEAGTKKEKKKTRFRSFAEKKSSQTTGKVEFGRAREVEGGMRPTRRARV